ncbi:LysR family transcriptional regulator [Aeromonas veronii]|uniref:LysR family transcriptional regulator n=1 Tax=Aeromonas veronii TaxID=654 RepID=UPI000E1E340E|nr:LysR family transcriptional regulator [Aeromonas veronii]RDU81394.1 LysR family transcriptional regulator [Aeromonas veronii]RDU92306.1 LysR family transcriptional regulator [Aeromonas veronii]TEY64518.1 LysR family transcriptional regulator [Aeromonas veronii]
MVFKQWPPLNVLRGFEAAARLGSFHQAAQELHLTQSAISQQIRSLEELLGQPLFHRQGRSVALTDAGQDLLETTQCALLQLAMGIQRLEQYRKPNQLVLNTSTAIARHWLLPRLGEFRRLHPDIDLWLFTSDEEPDMAEQTVDLALRWDLGPQAECRHQHLLADRLLPVATATVLSRPAEERTTLHGERELDWHHWTLRGGEDLHLQTRGLNFSDPGLLLEAASAGLGVALVSELLSRPARQQGLLLPLSTRRVKGPQWNLLVHQDSEGMPECRAFCHWLGQQFADGEPDREEGGVATL